MDLKRIRTTIVTTLFSEDSLIDRIVLKGGTALELAHGIAERGSVDIDVSLRNDFAPDELTAISETFRRILADRFDAEGMVVFGYRFSEKPPPRADDPTPWWGGYKVEFKLIGRDRYEQLRHDPDPQALYREAQVIDPHSNRRTFSIDISKHEFCEERVAVEMDGYRIWAYTLEALAFEKLRAICQQMSEYPQIHEGRKRPRARDFYDIYEIISQSGIDLALPENLDLCRDIFEAKRVPLRLLSRIGEDETGEFHRIDWDEVAPNIPYSIEFDTCFEAVVYEVERLEPLWNE